MKKTITKTVEVEVSVCDVCASTVGETSASIDITVVDSNTNGYTQEYELCDRCLCDRCLSEFQDKISKYVRQHHSPDGYFIAENPKERRKGRIFVSGTPDLPAM